MTIKNVVIDGRKATMADMPDDLVKILFDDGEMRIAVAVTKGDKKAITKSTFEAIMKQRLI